jgi:hypothetical protein
VLPYDTEKQRQDYDRILSLMAYLCDDPCRSLASVLRRIASFDNVKAPFSEFAWTGSLRRQLNRILIERDFNEACWPRHTLLAVMQPGTFRASAPPGRVCFNRLYHAAKYVLTGRAATTKGPSCVS